MGGDATSVKPVEVGPSGFDLVRGDLRGKPDTAPVWIVVGDSASAEGVPDGLPERQLTVGELKHVFDPDAGPVVPPPVSAKPAWTTSPLNVRRETRVARETFVVELPKDWMLMVVDVPDANKLRWCKVVGGQYDGMFVCKDYLRFR